MGNSIGSEEDEYRANIANTSQGRNSVRVQGKLLQYKVIMLGGTSIGKTSIIYRFTKSEFSDLLQPTERANFYQPYVKTENGQTIMLNLWDTDSSPRYSRIIDLYVKDAKGAIIVYDIGDSSSFENVTKWLNILFESLKKEHVICYLVGNKKDKGSQSREVRADIAQAFAIENQILFTEVSAKTGEGVNELFKSLAEELSKKFGFLN